MNSTFQPQTAGINYTARVGLEKRYIVQYINRTPFYKNLHGEEQNIKIFGKWAQSMIVKHFQTYSMYISESVEESNGNLYNAWIVFARFASLQ